MVISPTRILASFASQVPQYSILTVLNGNILSRFGSFLISTSPESDNQDRPDESPVPLSSTVMTKRAASPQHKSLVARTSRAWLYQCNYHFTQDKHFRSNKLSFKRQEKHGKTTVQVNFLILQMSRLRPRKTSTYLTKVIKRVGRGARIRSRKTHLIGKCSLKWNWTCILCVHIVPSTSNN